MENAEENAVLEQSLLSQFSLEPEERKAMLQTIQTIPSSARPLRRNLSGPARLLVAALGLGGMADALFYGQQAGVGAPLFALLTMGALVGLALRENLRVNLRAVIITGLPLLFFTGMIAIRDNGFLNFLNVTVSLFLAGLLVHFFAGGSLTTLGIGGFLGLPWLSFGNTFASAAPAIKRVLEKQAGQFEGRRKLFPLFRGLLLAAPILAFLIPLLTSADAAFAQKVSRLFGWKFPENWGERVWRVLLVIGVAWGIAGGFVYALTRQERKEITHKIPWQPLGFIEGMTPLVLVCLLFGSFLLVQAEYLFGGVARVQAIPGLTYAEYARRGFGELVTVAAFTLTLALAWQRLMRRETAGQSRFFHSVVTVLVGLTLVILVSANQRMSAYEAAYGATETRIYVDTFIVFLGAVLVWFAVTIWMNAQRFFAFGGFLCILGYVASLNLLNPDAAVARTNISRSRAGKQKFDTYTVRRLSDDAIPLLCAALDTTTGGEHHNLAAALRLRLTESERQRKQSSWPSCNLSRQTALRQLRSRAASLPSDADARTRLNNFYAD